MTTTRRVRTGRPSRSRLMRGMLAAAVAFGLFAVGSWVLRPRSDPRAGSVVVSGENVAITGAVPRTYRIDYRLEVRSGDDTTVTRSSTLVHRPFESRVGESVESFTRHSERQTSFWIPPGPTSADRRPDAVLADAVDDGYARRRETRRVAGRLCRVFRTGAGSVSSSLPPLKRAKDVTDICVDASGLVLEEVTITAGQVSRRNVAESVTESPRLKDEAFDVRTPQGDARQIGSVLELEPDSRLPGGTFWELPDPPKRFSVRGRYAVVPAGQPGFSDPTSRSSVITFVSEVWRDGADVFVIEQGATQGAAPFSADPNARKVKVDELGKGELRYSMLASEVRVLLGGTRFVIVRGTLPPSKLLEIARNLRGVPEGPLRVKKPQR